MTDSKLAITVTGPVTGEELGPTLPHEHIFASTAYAFPAEEGQTQLPITIENLGKLRFDLMENVDNITLDENCGQAKELSLAKEAGIQTIVELTPPTIGRNPEKLKDVSIETGLNIICGSGYYLRPQQRPEEQDFVDAASVEEIADVLVEELTDGIRDTDVRAGVLGEVALDNEPHPSEIKALEAAVIAQQRTGAPLWVHLMKVPVAEVALEIFDRVEPIWDRVIFCHMDFDIRDLYWHKEALSRGINVELDFFGTTWWHNDAYIYCPTDPQRLLLLEDLAGQGFADQLLISHDICTRIQLTRWGGFGYGYIPNYVPQLMSQLDIDPNLLEQFLVKNTRRLLCWASS